MDQVTFASGDPYMIREVIFDINFKSAYYRFKKQIQTSKNRFQNKIIISQSEITFVPWSDIFSLLYCRIYHRKMKSFSYVLLCFFLSNGSFPICISICFILFIVHKLQANRSFPVLLACFILFIVHKLQANGSFPVFISTYFLCFIFK